MDVAGRKRRRRLNRLGSVVHMVVLFVAWEQSGKDLDRVLDTRLLDIDGLEAPLERRVLGEVFAVLLRRGGADNLEHPAREHRLKHGARVDGALGRTARSDERVHLVDEEDDVVGLCGLLDHALQALLELAAILGARYEPRQVKRPDVLVHKVLGHVAGSDFLRKAFHDGGLAHTGVAQDERIVLGASRKDLHHARDLFFAANHRVELAVARFLREVGAELLENRGVVALALARIAREERQAGAGAHGCGSRERTASLVLRGELLDRLAHGRRRDAKAHEDVHGHARRFVHDAKKQVLGRYVGLVVLARVAEALLHHGDDGRGEGELALPGVAAGGAIGRRARSALGSRARGALGAVGAVAVRCRRVARGGIRRRRRGRRIDRRRARRRLGRGSACRLLDLVHHVVV